MPPDLKIEIIAERQALKGFTEGFRRAGNLV